MRRIPQVLVCQRSIKLVSWRSPSPKPWEKLTTCPRLPMMYSRSNWFHMSPTPVIEAKWSLSGKSRSLHSTAWRYTSSLKIITTSPTANFETELRLLSKTHRFSSQDSKALLLAKLTQLRYLDKCRIRKPFKCIRVWMKEWVMHPKLLWCQTLPSI